MSMEATVLTGEESDFKGEFRWVNIGCPFSREGLEESLSRVHLEEKRLFHHFTENVADENVGFLDAGRTGGRNHQ